MKTIVNCYVKQKTGRDKRYKSVDGENFKDRKGNTYNAPVLEKHEILEETTIWGKKLRAFYREGQENPFPLGRDSKWKETTNHDQDVDMLVKITREALLEAGLADMKINASLGGLGLIILMLFIHFLMG